MYKSAICHLHAGLEGTASIAGYCYEANKYGIDVVWLSDHDGRLAMMDGLCLGETFRQYDFSKGNPDNVLNEKGKPTEDFWQETDINTNNWQFQINSEDNCFQISTRSEENTWQGGTISLKTVGFKSERPLYAQPSYIIGLKTDINPDDKDARLIIRIPLSQTPPEHELVYLTYVLGTPLTQEKHLPLTFANNGDIVLPLAEDAKLLGYGLDNTAHSLDIRIESRNGKEVSACLSKFKIETEIESAEAWAALQRELGEEVSRKYGVTVLSNFEISYGERHMTYFGPPMPIFPYDQNPNPTMEEMNAYAQEHGGIVSFNHPFYDLKYYGLDRYNRLDPWKEVEIIAEKLIQNKLGGAKLIEIGFPAGGYEMEPRHNMYLWDLINLAGLRVYGMGVSDAHCNMTWDKGSNYANYIASPDCTVENLLAGMKSGNLYMAEPARFQGEVRVYTDQGKTMGETQTDDGIITISLTEAPPDSKLIWIIDGKQVKEEQVVGTSESSISLAEGKHFVRAELHAPDGRVILVTNPVWLSN